MLSKRYESTSFTLRINQFYFPTLYTTTNTKS